MPAVKCIQCGAAFVRSPAHIQAYVTGPFCSNRCSGLAKRHPRVAFNCFHCGAAGLKPRANATGPRLFCNSACYYAHKSVGTVDERGYRLITVDGRQVREHRWVMEQALGRALLASEDVHHIDGDKTNNTLANLSVLEHSAHGSEHRPLTWDIETAKALLAKGLRIDDVGKALGVTGNAIRLTLRHRGIKVGSLRPRNAVARCV